MKSQVKNFLSLQLKQRKKIVAKLPDSPGVYLFLARRRGGKHDRKILYIGKATSLRDRVRSYFSIDIAETRSPLIVKMLSQFNKIDYIKTDSVLEALILEANLIKKYQPEANIKEKDNRSFNYVVITDEAFPRVLITRARHLLKFQPNFQGEALKSQFGVEKMTLKYIFGPFPNGSQLKEAVKITRKMFPFRDKCLPPTPSKFQGQALKSGLQGLALNKKMKKVGRPCFNRQIGLCPGVCTGGVSEKEYAQTINNIVLFFESNKKKLIKNLNKQMKAFVKVQQFEKAQKIKKLLVLLSHIQDISLIKDKVIQGFALNKTIYKKDSNGDLGEAFRVEGYDVAHMSGKNVVGVMTVVEDGYTKISDYRKFRIKDNPGINDIRALSEVLSRRLAHIEWPMPDLIVVDGAKAQKNVFEKILKENMISIPVMSVVKNEKHKPKEILGDRLFLKHEKEILLVNSEAHRFAISYHDKLRRKFLF